MFKKSSFSVFGVLILGMVIFASPAHTYDHDVGVIDLWWSEEPEGPDDPYYRNEITVSAEVENFGVNAEYDIVVKCEISPCYSDSAIYNLVQCISFLDCSGNESGNSYTTEVTFPTIFLGDEYKYGVVVECWTELTGDENPGNDDFIESICSGIEEDENQPPTYSLTMSNITFSEDSQVQFALSHTSWVKLDVFDVDGRWVKLLINDIYEPGSHAVEWDGRDNTGRKTSTGVYFVRMQADEFTDACKVVVIN
jgi:hypothetical protein